MSNCSNLAKLERYQFIYNQKIQNWLREGKKGQWVVMDDKDEMFFKSSSDAHQWNSKYHKDSSMLVKYIE